MAAAYCSCAFLETVGLAMNCSLIKSQQSRRNSGVACVYHCDITLARRPPSTSLTRGSTMAWSSSSVRRSTRGDMASFWRFNVPCSRSWVVLLDTFTMLLIATLATFTPAKVLFSSKILSLIPVLTGSDGSNVVGSVTDGTSGGAASLELGNSFETLLLIHSCVFMRRPWWGGRWPLGFLG